MTRSPRPPSPPARPAVLHLVVSLPVLAALALGCRPEPRRPPAPAAAAPGVAGEDDRSAPLLVTLGDSLTDGWVLPPEQAWPRLAAAELGRRGLAVRLVNAGVSGDTTALGRDRLEPLLALEPDLVVVAIGINDGLEGIDLATTEANLRHIVAAARARGAAVLLVGMPALEHWEPDYRRDFAAVFPRLAAELGVPLVPDLLAGVQGVAELNLPDGLHPSAAGHRRLAENVLPALAPLVEALRPAPASSRPERPRSSTSSSSSNRTASRPREPWTRRRRSLRPPRVPPEAAVPGPSTTRPEPRAPGPPRKA